MNNQTQAGGAQKVRRLNRREASKYLLEKWGMRRTPGTLAKFACTGDGPMFEKDGRIPLYTEEMLYEFARKQLSPPVFSTSELKTMAAA